MLPSGIPKRFKLQIHFGLVLGFLLLGLLGCWSHKAAVKAPATTEPAPARIAGIMVDQLDKANLKVKWSATTPLGRAKGIKQLFYHQGQLYVISDHNQLCAYDGASGILRWSAYLASPSLTCSLPGYYQDNLLFVLGKEVVEVRRGDGKIERNVTLPFKPTTLAARTENRLFVGGEDKWFYAIRLSDMVPVWQAVAEATPSGAIALVADSGKVYFTRSNGAIEVSLIESRSLIWKAQAEARCAGAMVDGGQCLVASMDTALYCFDPNTGVLQWKYLAGGTLSEMPITTKQAIYQVVDGKSLVCLNRDGQLRWELPAGRYLLAEHGAKTFAMTADNQLTVMNNADKKRQVSFFVPNMKYFAVNTEDGMIFMATADGHIVSLAP